MDGKASGEAFVVLESEEDVQAALAMDKQKLRDRSVVFFLITMHDHVQNGQLSVRAATPLLSMLTRKYVPFTAGGLMCLSPSLMSWEGVLELPCNLCSVET